MPAKRAAIRKLPDNGRIEDHMVEFDALSIIGAGEQSAWNVLVAEALAAKRFDKSRTVADGDLDAHPGW